MAKCLAGAIDDDCDKAALEGGSENVLFSAAPDLSATSMGNRVSPVR